MSVIWQKVWFDLWHNKVRTILSVLSIAAGVFAIGAIFGMSDTMLNGMDAAHRSVTPSHINMFLTSFISRDDALALRSIEGVADVEPYNSLTIRYKVQPEDDWKQGALVMRDDYTRQHSDLVQLKQGNWPQGKAIGIERLASQFLKIGVNDHVLIRYNNIEHDYPIGGLIRHPFVPPPDFGGPPYFFANAEQMERFGIPSGKFSSILVRVTPYSEAQAKAVAAAIKDHLAKQGVGVGGTLYQNPDKHWGRMYVEGMTLVMQVLACISLFMSVVLVFNTMTALITQQTNQIGIIKAIGGRSRTIVKVYLAGVLAYGILALVVALPLGMLLSYNMTRWFLNLFNIDYSTFQVSAQATELQIIAALGVPLLAGLIPVLGAAGITVRQAIASYGLGGDFGSNRFDRWVERLGSKLLPSHYATALGNLFRRKGRLILTQLVLVSAGTMFLLVMTLSTSITYTLDEVFQRRNFDVTISFRERQREERIAEVAAATDGVDSIELWPTYSVSLLRDGKRAKEAGLGAALVGLPIGSDFYHEVIVAGRWLTPGDGHAIVLNRDTADKNDIKVGDTVTLEVAGDGKTDWQVVGLYQVIFNDNFSADAIYAPREAVYQASNKINRGNLLHVRTNLHAESSVNNVTTQLKDQFEARSLKVGYSQTEIEIKRRATSQFAIFVSMMLMLAVIIAVVGGIGLMGALSIGVVERTKEIGVLRAIGARSRTIMSMFMLEGVLQGILSWAFAILISLGVAPAIAGAMGRAIFNMELTYQYNWSAVGVWLIIVLIISTLASIVPSRRATLVSVRDSLSYA
ncbi:MAG TPA: FtsX-like permease family protein [Anaerolineae bacterium]|nr:FtsX-like permease family protein [Anaerolineae bacterium]